MVLNRILTAVFSSMQGSVGELRFEGSRALVGDLSQFNMWDRPLTRAELSALAHCSTGMLGNVVPWTSREVEVFGGVTKQSAEHCGHHTSMQQWGVTSGGCARRGWGGGCLRPCQVKGDWKCLCGISVRTNYLNSECLKMVTYCFIFTRKSEPVDRHSMFISYAFCLTSYIQTLDQFVPFLHFIFLLFFMLKIQILHKEYLQLTWTEPRNDCHACRKGKIRRCFNSVYTFLSEKWAEWMLKRCVVL